MCSSDSACSSYPEMNFGLLKSLLYLDFFPFENVKHGVTLVARIATLVVGSTKFFRHWKDQPQIYHNWDFQNILTSYDVTVTSPKFTEFSENSYLSQKCKRYGNGDRYVIRPFLIIILIRNIMKIIFMEISSIISM